MIRVITGLSHVMMRVLVGVTVVAVMMRMLVRMAIVAVVMLVLTRIAIVAVMMRVFVRVPVIAVMMVMLTRMSVFTVMVLMIGAGFAWHVTVGKSCLCSAYCGKASKREAECEETGGFFHDYLPIWCPIK